MYLGPGKDTFLDESKLGSTSPTPYVGLSVLVIVYYEYRTLC